MDDSARSTMRTKYRIVEYWDTNIHEWRYQVQRHKTDWESQYAPWEDVGYSCSNQPQAHRSVLEFKLDEARANQKKVVWEE